uniref:Uncharacterized protein n=1 Tax=Chromera velia CCMP2878 TaxID=1169474 RepID=A0A0G4G081_9ALVE|eukprot:Cvel_19587.t1-p1 / transcript=Cvel_19587.t1 / gene=Cvel_19587 / organism=Chromera_velia_CCMP2878 / gene_product=Alpha-1,3-mannosyltransferase CMT1, putative / transcript_product=Alpha-1,3-mannosyltransferase CMT1, putative / location=Cvel_scaffold1701:25984-28062(-) / protein_length=480 / sequence_SO=supercontig / SO=protein_coding / is_pseudo=false
MTSRVVNASLESLDIESSSVNRTKRSLHRLCLLGLCVWYVFSFTVFYWFFLEPVYRPGFTPGLCRFGSGLCAGLSVVFVLNVHNNEVELPYLLSQVLRTIGEEFLNLPPQNVAISIYENGSKDETPTLLRDFAEVLTERGIWNRIVTDPAEGTSTYLQKGWRKMSDRMAKFVDYRNRALAPLLSDDFPLKENERGEGKVKVIFLNDIRFEAEDLVHLISTADMSYDIVCPMDFYYQFYDRFATRETSGDWMEGWWPYSLRHSTAEAIRQFAPFQVLSCWNGVAVFDLSLLKEVGVRFRRERDQRCECPQCECTFFGLDAWKAGRRRVLVNPAVKVAYNFRFYRFAHKFIDLMTLLRSLKGTVYYPPPGAVPPAGLTEDRDLEEEEKRLQVEAEQIANECRGKAAIPGSNPEEFERCLQRTVPPLTLRLPKRVGCAFPDRGGGGRWMNVTAACDPTKWQTEHGEEQEDPQRWWKDWTLSPF